MPRRRQPRSSTPPWIPRPRRRSTTLRMRSNGGYEYQSVGAWWETLDCRLMRIAAGDGKHGRFLVPVLCALPRFRSSEDSGRGGAGARQQGRDGPAGAHRSRSLPAPEPSGVDSRNLGQLWCSCFSGFVAVLGAPHCADRPRVRASTPASWKRRLIRESRKSTDPPGIASTMKSQPPRAGPLLPGTGSTGQTMTRASPGPATYPDSALSHREPVAVPRSGGTTTSPDLPPTDT